MFYSKINQISWTTIMPTTPNLEELLYNKELLERELSKNPQLINKKDKQGMTLLHHIAVMEDLGQSSLEPIIDILLAQPSINFNIEDNKGNTAIHLAASSRERTNCEFIFPKLVEKAEKNQFNFSMLDKQGQAIIHLASRLSYSSPITGKRINKIETLIKYAPSLDLNVLSSSGSSALFYALNSVHFPEADTLLNAGANPSLGNEGRKPLEQVKKHLKTIEQLDKNSKHYKVKLDKLTELHQKITDTLRTDSLSIILEQYNKERQNDPRERFGLSFIPLKVTLKLKS